MLIEEFDVSIVDALGNLLSNLMRRAPFDHVKSRPPILSFGTRRSTDKEVVLQLTLQIVLLDMIGQGGGDLPAVELSASVLTHACEDRQQGRIWIDLSHPMFSKKLHMSCTKCMLPFAVPSNSCCLILTHKNVHPCSNSRSEMARPPSFRSASG